MAKNNILKLQKPQKMAKTTFKKMAKTKLKDGKHNI